MESLLATLRDEVLHLAHAFALADEDFAHLQFGLQAAILVAQGFQGENVFQRDRGDPCHRAEKVDMVIFELGSRTRGQQVHHPDGSLDRNQRNAQHAFAIAGFGSGPAEDRRTFPQSALHQVAAQA